MPGEAAGARVQGAPRRVTAGLAAEAWLAALAAAERYRLRLAELTDVTEHYEIAALLNRVWLVDPGASDVLAPDLIRALAYSGNYVAGAYRDGRLLGAAIAFLGPDHLHSHVIGVDPEQQARGVGYALKQHERAWALSRGLTEVRWTFDPLVGRNAYFSVHKLGAQPTAYLMDFYGPLSDGLNAGDHSDRLYVSWQLGSPPVVAAARAVVPPRTVDAPLLLDRAGDGPGAVAAELPGGGLLLVAVPSDIEALRRRDRSLALRWRARLRTALTNALDGGFRIVDVARTGHYLLEKD